MNKPLSSMVYALSLLTSSVALAQEIDPFEELASMAVTVAKQNVTGGGSIRAKKEVDPELARRLNESRTCQVRVVERQSTANFPQTILRLNVRKAAADGLGKDVKIGETIVAIPKYKYNERKEFLANHADNRFLLLTPYLKSGDTVAIRFLEKRDNVWIFDYIERL